MASRVRGTIDGVFEVIEEDTDKVIEVFEELEDALNFSRYGIRPASVEVAPVEAPAETEAPPTGEEAPAPVVEPVVEAPAAADAPAVEEPAKP